MNDFIDPDDVDFGTPEPMGPGTDKPPINLRKWSILAALAVVFVGAIICFSPTQAPIRDATGLGPSDSRPAPTADTQ